MSTQPQPLFDMSQAKPIFDMSQATPIGGEQAPKPPEETGVIAGLKRNTIGAVQGLYHTFTDKPTDMEAGPAKGSPYEGEHALGERLVMGPARETNADANRYLDAAKQHFQQGEYGQALDTGASGLTDKLLAVLPVIGPAINTIAKRYEKGDKSGAAVDLGALLAPHVLEGAKIAAGTAVKAAVPEGAPAEMYQGALKPSTRFPAGKIDSMVQAGLRNEIPVSKGGLAKIGGLIDDLNNKIQDTIDAGSAKGATVNKYAVASRLKDAFADQVNQVTPNKGLAQVARSGNEFLSNNPNEIPASQAQAMKIGTYKQIGKSYGQMSNAAVESQKALARGIKEELATQFPEIGDMNAEESRLIDLNGALEKAVTRIGNHQVIGIGTPIAAGAAQAVTGSAKLGAVVGILKGVLDNPVVKSKLAIALSRKGVAPTSAFSRIAAYSDSLGAAANDAQGGGQRERDNPL